MVFSIPANGRRNALRILHRPSYRMELERLEDRVVPSLADGTILVCTAPSTFSNQDQSSFPTGIIAIDPASGAQTPLSTGGLFTLPTYVREAPNQQLYVTDIEAYGSGAIFRIDPNTGQQSLVTKGGLINGPNALVYMNGFLYVANLGDSSGKVHTIVQVDPNSGAQKLISDGSSGGFSVPTGVAPAPGNNIYVADEPGNVQGADPGSVWIVNLDTGKQTLLSHGGLLDHPQDIAIEPNGDLIVGNTGSAANDYVGSVIRIDPQTGAQSPVATFGYNTGLDSLDLGSDGTVFVGAISTGATPGRIYAVNAKTGSQSTTASGGSISMVEGIRVFHTGSGGAAPTVDPGTPPLADGSIIVANRPLSGASAPAGLVAVDPNTGAQSLVSTAGLFSMPESVRQGPNGQFYVTDYSALTTGAIIAVDPANGHQSVVASGGNINGPVGLTIINGYLYVADAAGVPNLVKVNLSTGEQQVISSGGNFSAPVSLAAGPNNTIYWADEYAFGGIGAIFSVDLQSGAQSVVTQGGMLDHMIDLELDANGNLLAYNASGSVIRIDAQTHVQNQLASGGSLASLDGGTVDVNHGGTIFVSALPAGSLDSRILAIDPSTGAQRTISSAGNLSQVTGMVVFNKNNAGFTTTTGVRSPTGAVVVTSANPMLVGQPVTLTATVIGLGPSGTSGINPTGVVTFFDGTTLIGQAALRSASGTNSVSISVSGLSAGSHTIIASYGGDQNYLPSKAGMIQTVVNALGAPSSNSQASTTTTLTVSAQVVPFGQPILLIGNVSSGASSSAAMTGSLTFLVDGTPLASFPLTASTAAFTLVTQSPGKHSVSASYGGDATHTGSSSSTMTITVGTPNQRFVSQLYQTVLHRQPDSGGLATWTGALDHGVSRTQVAQAIEQSAEARAVQVQGLYQQFLHRNADPFGLNTFVTFLGTGGTLEQVRTVMTSSPEYLQVRGGGTQAGFVTALYNDVLNRSPADPEVALYTKALSAGATPGQAATAITTSTEGLRNLVASSYKEFLKRPADDSGLNSYVNAMKIGVLNQDTVATAMLGSEEFLVRV